MEDARQTKRVPVTWRALIFRADGKIQAKLSNISNGGFGLIADRSFPAGSVLQLAVLMPANKPDRPPMVLEAEVRVVFSVLRTGGFHTGLQVCLMNPQHAGIIERWIAAH